MNKGTRVLAATLTAVLTTANSVPAMAAGTNTALPTDTAVAGIALNISEYSENAKNADVSKVVSDATETEKADTADTAVAGIAKNISEYSENTKNADVSKVVSDATSEESEKAKEEDSKEAATEKKDAETKAEKEDTEKKDSKKEEKKEEASPYENIAITQVSNYVNIRKKPNTDSEILGKIYDNAAATILKTVNGEDGKWYYIKSGSVKGYMKAEFFVTGKKAEKIAKDVGNVLCRTTATTLRLREKASTSSDTLTLLAEDSVYSVLKENVTNKKGETFLKVLVSEGDEDGDDGLKGYISADYAEVYVEFEEAISIEEEKAELARQAELKRQEEEAAAAAAAAAAENNSSSRSSSGSSSSGSSSRSSGSSSGSSSKSSSGSSSSSSGSSSKSSSSTGAAIAAKAQQYAGWLPYVWGGASLSSGADCSGFTMSIYAAYGISLPHSSSAQASGGRSISSSELQPGDLVFYGNGGINHVAIYIGGGQICHEANSRRDCVIDSMGYCGSPVKYVTYTH